MFGKPDKTVRYKGLIVPLYGSASLRKLIGRKHKTFRALEKDGFIPTPMFKGGKTGSRRYYTSYELQAVMEINLDIGLPYRFTFDSPEDCEWSLAIAHRWKEIREKLSEGTSPEKSVTLKFASREALLAVIAENTKILGTGATLVTDVLLDRLLKNQILS